MNFNKILIQDVVNKRDYNKDLYKTDVSEDDDSFTSDEYYNNGDIYTSKITSPIKVYQNASEQLLRDVTPFGEESKFLYADSHTFDQNDVNNETSVEYRHRIWTN